MMTLSAKLNNEIYYSIKINDEFGRNNKFSCIGCNGELIYHRNISGIHIQHWAHKTPCPFETEPESEEHIKLKQWCYERFEAPTKHLPDSFFIGDQKPDLFLEYPTFSGVKQVAIECQCSKISLEKIKERTQKYTEKGIFVLWVLAGKYCEGEKDWKIIERNSKSFSVVEKWLQSIYFGRIYYASYDGWEYNCIQPTKLLWNGYKKSRYVDLSPTTYSTKIQLNCVETTDQEGNNYFIARLWDKAWWSK